MTDLTLALKLTADGSGLIGALQLSRRELDALTASIANNNKQQPADQSKINFTKEQARAFRELTEALDPALKRQREFLQGQALLNDAMKAGQINAQQHARFTRTLNEEYKAASETQSRFSIVTKEAQSAAANAGGSLGLMGRVLQGLGPGGFAAAAGIGLFVGTAVAGLKKIAEEEQPLLRIDALLKATGNASGLTRGQIVADSASIAKTSLATKDSMLDAAGVLLTFRNISGPVFTDTLRLSQDLAAVMGGDVKSAAFTLGRALQNPVEGLSSLRRMGISFNETQAEMIERMVKSGRQADAMRMILGELERQVGGAGAAEAGGLTGAWKQLNSELGSFSKRAVEAANGSEIALKALKLMADGVRAARKAMQPTKEEELAEQQNLANVLPKGSPGQKSAAARVAALKAEIAAQSEAQRQALMDAAQGQADAQRNANSDLVKQRRREMDKQLAEVNPSANMAYIKREGALTLQGLEQLRGQPGVDESALNQLVEDTKKKIALDLANAAKPLKDNEKALTELRNQIAAYGNNREAFIEKAVQSLNEHASPEQIKKAKEYAGAIYDQAKAEEAYQATLQQAMREGREEDQARKQQREANKALALEDAKAAIAIKDAVDPQREYNRTLDEANRLLERNMITVGEWAQTVEDAELKKLEASKTWEAGVERAMLKFKRDSEDAAKQAEEFVTTAFNGMTDAVLDWRKSGEFNINKWADSFIDALIRIQLKALETELAAQAAGLLKDLGGFLGFGSGGSKYAVKPGTEAYFNPDIAHTGGQVGSTPFNSRSVPSSLFANAPRFHTGLMPGEFPAILEKGETVWPKGSMPGGTLIRFFDQRGSSAPDLDVQSGRDSDGRETIDITVKESWGRTAGRGGFDKTMDTGYGVRRMPGLRQ